MAELKTKGGLVVGLIVQPTVPQADEARADDTKVEKPAARKKSQRGKQ